MTVETIADWGTAFATASESRDPNRIHQMLEVLMEDPLRSQGSFIDSSRLYMLQGGIAQQEWRVAELLHRLVDFMRPYLSHPYQNVRDRIGSVLTNIYLSDIEYPDRKERSNKRNPNIAAFMAEVRYFLGYFITYAGLCESSAFWNFVPCENNLNFYY